MTGNEVENPEESGQKKGLFSRLKEGLKKTSDRLSQGIKTIFVHRKLDDAALEELEELLITADMNLSTVQRLLASIRKKRFGQDVTDVEIRTLLAEEIAEIVRPYEKPLALEAGITNVILLIGVNGGGKTTTLSKLGKLWKDEGKKVRFVAGDTFRAAAVGQLQVWGQRLNIPVEAAPDKGDAAGLAFDAYEKALEEKDDVLLIDTAGRLQNRSDLMEELKKIDRVLKKKDANLPHQCLMVLDATTGQNLYSQVEIFLQYVKVSGLIMTKLDGTARGGVLVGLADHFKLPIHAIGVGETPESFRPFKAEDFSRAILGLADGKP